MHTYHTYMIHIYIYIHIKCIHTIPYHTKGTETLIHIHIHTYICVYICIYSYVHTYICMYMYIYILHTHTHTHTHTHINILVLPFYLVCHRYTPVTHGLHLLSCDAPLVLVIWHCISCGTPPRHITEDIRPRNLEADRRRKELYLMWAEHV